MRSTIADSATGGRSTLPRDVCLDDCFSRSVLDSLPDATAVVDGVGVILAVNSAWDRFTAANGGTTAACGVGVDYLAVCARAARAGCREASVAADGLLSVLVGGRRAFELEYNCPSPDEDRWFLQRIMPLVGIKGAVLSHVDITRRKHMELGLAESARRDCLTGLLNRSGLEASGPTASAVLFVDLDGFKSVNDGFGHAAGDEVLARAANRIVHQTRHADRVARVGGDEFVVVLDDVELGEAEAIAARIQDALSLPYQVGGDLAQIGASVGIARRLLGEPLADLLARADAAMYAEKQARAGH